MVIIVYRVWILILRYMVYGCGYYSIQCRCGYYSIQSVDVVIIVYRVWMWLL